MFSGSASLLLDRVVFRARDTCRIHCGLVIAASVTLFTVTEQLNTVHLRYKAATSCKDVSFGKICGVCANGISESKSEQSNII